MPHNPRGTSVLAYANGFTLWHYYTSDLLHPGPDTTDGQAVLAPGYFDRAHDMMTAGDMIMVNAATSRPNVTTGAMLLVASAGTEGVTVAVMGSAAAPTTHTGPSIYETADRPGGLLSI